VLLLERYRKVSAPRGQGGFTLIEMLIAMMILLAVAGIVMSGMVQMMFVQGSVANRSEMHSSVRSATELLQQEIGQAGRVTLPVPVTMTTPVVIAVPGTPSAPTVVTVNPSTAGMFNGEYLVVDTGANQEIVQISGLTANTFTAVFYYSHPSAVGATSWPVTVQGAFITGIVPPHKVNTAVAGLPLVPNTNAAGTLVGSTGTKLKLYGDVNGDGNMVYIEYSCNTGTTAAPGNLYRNVIPVPAEGVTITKPGVDASKIVLANVLANPPDPNGNAVPCFTYQEMQQGQDVFVVNVAVTLTVQTPLPDPKTHSYQPETKALLNVSPRNIFEAWELAGANAINRTQPMPSSVSNLL